MTAPKKLPGHCSRGHEHAKHGKQRRDGSWVCLKCKELSIKDTAEMLAKFDGPTMLSLLAEKWDNEVRCYGLVHSVEDTAEWFGIECETVEIVLFGKLVNYTFSWGKSPRARRSGQDRSYCS